MSTFKLLGGPEDLNGTETILERGERQLWPPVQLPVEDWLGTTHWYWVNHELDTDTFTTVYSGTS